MELESNKKELSLKSESRFFAYLEKNKLFLVCNKFLETRFRKGLLPLLGFFDAPLVALPLEPVVIGYALKYRKEKLWGTVFWTTLTSTLGALVVFGVGYFSVDFFLDLFSADILKYYDIFQETTQSHPFFWLLFILGSAFSSSIPFSPLSFLAGLFKINPLLFALGIFFGRGIRLFLFFFLSQKYGKKMVFQIFQHLWTFTLAALLVLALYFFLWFGLA